MNAKNGPRALVFALWKSFCAQGRTLEVVNLAENDREEVLHDLVSVIDSFASRLSGQHRAKRKTEAMLAQLKEEGTGAPGRATSDSQD